MKRTRKYKEKGKESEDYRRTDIKKTLRINQFKGEDQNCDKFWPFYKVQNYICISNIKNIFNIALFNEEQRIELNKREQTDFAIEGRKKKGNDIAFVYDGEFIIF